MDRASLRARFAHAILLLVPLGCGSTSPIDADPASPDPFGSSEPAAGTAGTTTAAPSGAFFAPPAVAGEATVAPGRVSVEAVDAPIDALLHALAADAGLELDLLGAGATAAVTLRALDLPLERVLERLARQTPMRWSIDNDRLEVDRRERFTASYRVDYLNIDRLTTSRVGLATRVGTIGAGRDESAGSANHSDTQVENRSEHRFWSSLTADLAALVDGDGSVAPGDSRSGATLVVNRDAGLVTLTGGPRLHQAVKRYVDTVNARASRQVLIEATVVEVALSESFAAGIDWRLLAHHGAGLGFAQQLFGVPLADASGFDRLAPPGSAVSLVRSSSAGALNATLTLLEQFGDVRILSKPRIIALTNQSSILKVVDNRVYFTVRVERQRDDETEDIFTQTDIHTVPVGLVMHVTPFVTADDEVLLNVRPTLSRILGFVDDPNPELVAARVVNSVPEIQVREMESMLRVQSGDLAIIGGLMQDTRDQDDRSVPWLSRLPVVGGLFRAKRRARRQTELLVVLRPSVLPDRAATTPDGVAP